MLITRCICQQRLSMSNVCLRVSVLFGTRLKQPAGKMAYRRFRVSRQWHRGRHLRSGRRTGVRPQLEPTVGPCSHVAELVFFFVLKGSVTLELMGRGIEPFNRGDSVVLPSNFSYTLVESTQDLELLEVTLPDIVETRLLGA